MLNPRSYSRVLLRKLPPQRLNAIRNPLELILLLGSNLADIARRRIVVFIRPLDLKRVQLNLGVEAVDVLGRMRGEAAQGVDQTHQLVDVVP